MIYVIFLFSIILHEIGHLFMAKILKININRVKFKIIGISAEFENEVEEKYIRKIFVLLMGPFMNSLIGSSLLLVKEFTYREEIIYINLILFLFNLLPIIPLDGGKIIFYMLNLKYNFEKSFKISDIVSKIILSSMTLMYALVIFIIKNIEIAIIIIYLWYIFIKEEKNIEWYIKINKNVIKHLNLQKKCAKIPSVIK